MSRSPFPGTDPYLEAHWLDVHTKLVAYSADALNARLPDDLIARTKERVAIESDDQPPRHVSPDVRVLEAVGAGGVAESGNAAGSALAPYRLVALVEPITERFIEIIDMTGERLITVIEFASPTNKRGKGLEAFIDKRDKLLAGGVNVVEIDLIRSGDWREMLGWHRCPPEARSLYRATIRVPDEPMAVYLQPIFLRKPLPAVRIPLRPSEAPIELELQPLLDQAYHNGRYARTIDYTRPPDPPLEVDDAAWADELLGRAGKR